MKLEIKLVCKSDYASINFPGTIGLSVKATFGIHKGYTQSIVITVTNAFSTCLINYQLIDSFGPL